MARLPAPPITNINEDYMDDDHLDENEPLETQVRDIARRLNAAEKGIQENKHDIEQNKRDIQQLKNRVGNLEDSSERNLWTALMLLMLCVNTLVTRS